MKKGDRFLYLALLLVFAALPLAFRFFAYTRTSQGGLVLEVVSDGRTTKEERLHEGGEPRELQLQAGGGSNTLLIEGTFVRMISADCPGGDCLRMPALTDERGSIVCLPHRLIVRLKGEGDKKDGASLDAVAY